MKLLNRLRQAMGNRRADLAGQTVWSIDERSDSEQLDDSVPASYADLLPEDFDKFTQGGRRHIPDIHEDIPPSGFCIVEDDSGLDPA